MRSSTRTLRPLVITTALAVSALTLIPPAAAQDGPGSYEGLPSGTKTHKTLVIGLDGATFSAMNPAELPNIAALRGAGMTATSNLYANPMAPTVSGAGWSTIATGVWPDKHRAVDNGFGGNNFEQYTDYQNRLEQADPAISTLVVGTWAPIPEIVFAAGTDLAISGGSDDNTTAKATDYLKNGNPDSTFVHLDDIDHAGHSSGSASAEYKAQLKVTDAKVGEILAAVKARPGYANEDWLIMVAADHGHTPTGGHGGNTPLERQTFVLAQGTGIPANSTRDDVKLVDIAPTVLKHEGVAIDPSWNLDGAPIDEITPDAFDTLRPELQTRADETVVPADLLGWTHKTPEGWSIDNSAMPAGGVAEWAGWSFATDEFWTNVDGNQGRETSVRNRNVFAVADSDEWDDKAHAPGKFDSTLVSPAYPLNGRAEATLGFASNYVVDGPQSGEVFASYDGGEPVLLKSYKINTNKLEKLALEVPAGAKSVQIRFKYTGTNSAFWTVDQVALTQEPWAVPVTTASMPDAGSSGWYTTSPSVTLATNSAKAQAAASEGAARTEYQLNGGAWQSYTAPVAMPEGVTTFTYRSVNGGGVAEDTKTLAAIKVDTTAPAVGAGVAGRTVTATASDAGSGLRSLEFSTDGGKKWQPYTAAVKAGDKAMSVQFQVSDVAGNSSRTRSVDVAALPVATPSASPAPSTSAAPSASTTTSAPASAKAPSATVAPSKDAAATGLAQTGVAGGLAWLIAVAALALLAGLALRVRNRRHV